MAAAANIATAISSTTRVALRQRVDAPPDEQRQANGDELHQQHRQQSQQQAAPVAPQTPVKLREPG